MKSHLLAILTGVLGVLGALGALGSLGFRRRVKRNTIKRRVNGELLRVGLAFDHRMAEMFHLTGIAPINLGNFSTYHEPWRAAQQAGCDVLLVPQWGNETFSNIGEWGLVEYFLQGRWGQLGAALRNSPDDPRPLWRRFVGECLLPLLPPALWRWQRGLRGVRDTRELASPLRADYVAKLDLNRRGDAQGGALGSAAPRNQRQWLAGALNGAFEESADVWQGFEQLYGVPMRDPAAYRPLAEFCFGLPTDVFLRDGEQRWLARQMARGVLPEAQRSNPRWGRHHPDWLAKLAPRLPETEREAVLRDALAAARAISADGQRANALAKLAPHLLRATRDMHPTSQSRFGPVRSVSAARFPNSW